MREKYELEKKGGMPEDMWKRLLREKRNTPPLKITWSYRQDYEIPGRLDKARGVSLRDDIRPGLIYFSGSYIASVRTPFGWLRQQFEDLEDAKEWQDDMESTEWE